MRQANGYDSVYQAQVSPLNSEQTRMCS